jgi:tetratricopeptide (TPR) repeat protein
MSQISPHFVQGINANLYYWQAQISRFTDADMGQFQLEQANLLLAVELGLGLTATQAAAAQLLLVSFPLIERCGFWQKWLPLFAAATAVDPSEHPVLHCKLLNRWGQLHRLLHLLDQAIAIHKKAEAAAQTSGDAQTMAEIYFNLSADYRQCRDYPQAEIYSEQALGIFNTLPGCEHGQAATLGMLGLIAMDRYALDTAEIRLRQALSIRQQLDGPTELARVYNGLALTLHRKKQFEAALYFYQQALDQLAATASERDKIDIFRNLGALYFEQEQYDKAEMIFRQAHATVLRTSGNFDLQAALAQNLGITLLKQQQFTEAESHFRHSYMLWQRLSDNLKLANTAGGLGEVLAEKRQYPEALAFYNEALHLLANFPDSAWAKKLRRDFFAEKEAVVRCLNEKQTWQPTEDGQLAAK